jgi:hypothetical protein
MVANESVPSSGLLSGQSNIEADFETGNLETQCISEAAIAENFNPNVSYYAHCVSTCLTD